MRPKRSVLSSSSAASTSSSSAHGAGFERRIAKSSATAVIVRSPPESSEMLRSSLPGGRALISMPHSSGFVSSSRTISAFPPLNIFLKITTKCSRTVLNVSRKSADDCFSMLFSTSLERSLAAVRSVCSRWRNSDRCSTATSSSMAARFTLPRRARRSFSSWTSPVTCVPILGGIVVPGLVERGEVDGQLLAAPLDEAVHRRLELGLPRRVRSQSFSFAASSAGLERAQLGRRRVHPRRGSPATRDSSRATASLPLPLLRLEASIAAALVRGGLAGPPRGAPGPRRSRARPASDSWMPLIPS